MAIPEAEFQRIIDHVEQTIKDTIAAQLKQSPTSSVFDPVAFRQALYSELTTYIDKQVLMLMAMLRRIAIDLYLASGDVEYRSGMIEEWHEHKGEDQEDEESDLYCVKCAYKFTSAEEKFCPRCATPREGVAHARTSSPQLPTPTTNTASSASAQPFKF